MPEFIHGACVTDFAVLRHANYLYAKHYVDLLPCCSKKEGQEILFPVNSLLRKQWLQALCLEGWQPSACCMVCCMHFLTKDMCTDSVGRRRLRVGAVPVIKVQIKEVSINSTVEATRLRPKEIRKIHNHAAHEDVKIKYEKTENLYAGELTLGDTTRHHKTSQGFQEDTLVNIIKIEKDDTIHKVDRTNVEMVSLHNEYIDNDIKIEVDDTVNLDTEDRNNDSMASLPTFSKDIITDIKIEENGTGYQDDEHRTNDVISCMHKDGAVIFKVEKDAMTQDDIDNINWNDSNIENSCNDDTEYSSAESEDFSISNKVNIEKPCVIKDLFEVELVCSGTSGGARKNNKRSITIGKRAISPKAKIDGGLTMYNNLSCDLCPYQTASGLHFVSHLKAHDSNLSFCCEKCHYRTVKKERLLSHMRVHACKKAYSCEACHLQFRYKSTLIKHSQLHCKKRKENFSDEGNLVRHSRTHCGVLYICDECKKEFKEHRDLKNHLRIHSGVKPYTCDLCNKSFTERGNLRRHLRMHSGKKPHSCAVCKRSFNERHHLKRHMTVHSGDKSFACDVCKREFGRRIGLQNHLKSCGKDLEKLHSCHLCKRSFNKKHHLQRHLRTHLDKKSCH